MAKQFQGIPKHLSQHQYLFETRFDEPVVQMDLTPSNIKRVMRNHQNYARLAKRSGCPLYQLCEEGYQK